MKGDLISIQSVHNRYSSLLHKFPRIGFSESELLAYLRNIQCLQEDYLKTVNIEDGKVLQLSDLYLQKRDWTISPKDKPRLERKLRGEE